MNVSQNFIKQPSKGLHIQVVKIVVPYCRYEKELHILKFDCIWQDRDILCVVQCTPMCLSEICTYKKIRSKPFEFHVGKDQRESGITIGFVVFVRAVMLPQHSCGSYAPTTLRYAPTIYRYAPTIYRPLPPSMIKTLFYFFSDDQIFQSF